MICPGRTALARARAHRIECVIVGVTASNKIIC
jgi:hypothetical protein